MSRHEIDALCGNERHPDGAWHPAESLPASWEWIRSWVHWWRKRKWGCACPRVGPRREHASSRQDGAPLEVDGRPDPSTPSGWAGAADVSAGAVPERICPRCLEPTTDGEMATVDGGLDPDELICVECAAAERNEIDEIVDHQRHIDELDP